ncbi:MAG: Mur ligase family protein [Reyranellaceae bacterium]
MEMLRAYAGPSLHAPCPAIRLDLEIAGDDGVTAASVPGLLDFLAAVLSRPRQGLAAAWGGLGLARLVGETGLALHRLAFPTRHWVDAVATGPAGRFRVVMAYGDPLLGLACAHHAAGWVGLHLAVLGGGPNRVPTPSQAIAEFAAAVRACNVGANAKFLIAEAMRRNIPWRRISPDDMAVILGQGHRQRRLRETLLDTQSKFAVDLARDKRRTHLLFASTGVPVPRQMRANDVGAALEAARLIGYPVVVKPALTDRGVAVHVNVGDEAALRRAFADAQAHGPVLVEQMIAGHDHRILVLGDRMIAAAQRLPAHVAGDGRRTVRQLVDQENARPHRVSGYIANLLQKIAVDQDMHDQLALQGLGLDSVPAAGVVVRLHGASNLSVGGVPRDVTRLVHPENRDAMVRAARIAGLELAGVDFITPDIGRSYREIGGAICEINGIPGLRAHVAAPGSPDVTGPIVGRMFADGDDGRIPIAAITGTNGKTTTSRLVAAMLERAGHCVGLATTDGVHIGGIEAARGDLAGASGAGAVLADPAVTAAVLETARGGLIRNGLGFDLCDVSAVLNVTDDHIGLDGIDSRDQMAAVKAVVLQAGRRAAVLNADDPLCVAMASQRQAGELWWFARRSDNEVVRQHVAAGGSAVTLAGRPEAERLVLWQGGGNCELLQVADIPCTFAGRADFNVANAMAAAAIGLGLGLPSETVAAALQTFEPSVALSSGRCNFVEDMAFRILVDYAHNPDGIAALCRFVATESVPGRRWLVLTSYGNRQDSHFRNVAAEAAGHFDRYVCATAQPRPRTAEEVSALLADGLASAGVDPATVAQAGSEAAAIRSVLGQADRGDLVVILSSNARQARKLIEEARAARQAVRES